MRQTIAMWAMIILGPLMVVASIAGYIRNEVFQSTAIEATAEVTSVVVKRARKGGDNVQLSLRLQKDGPPFACRFIPRRVRSSAPSTFPDPSE